MNITIAGYGFVGRSHGTKMSEQYTINVVDPKQSNEKIGDKDYSCLIIAVPTPQDDNGSCYMGHVMDVLADADMDKPILIKSTISLEGWNAIQEKYPDNMITFSPEFLREAYAQEDFDNTKVLYMGGRSVNFWKSVFEVSFPNIAIVEVAAEEAILGKYFRNSFLATKVSFFNQMYDLCKAYDVDYNQVRLVTGMDERIGMSHTTVTNPRQWGGTCFPKDTSAILYTAEQKDIDLTILREAVDYNQKLK